MGKEYEFAKYQNHALIHNRKFPLELSHSAVDIWLKESACQAIADKLNSTDKRCFVEAIKINVMIIHFGQNFIAPLT
jgi:hypothetical protein